MARTKKPSTHPRAQLYRHPSDEGSFVAPDLDEQGVWWTWRDMADDWSARDRYLGSTTDLRRIEPWLAYRSGWPGAKPSARETKQPQRMPPQELRRTCLRVLVTTDEANAITVAALAKGLTVSSYLRGVIVGEFPASVKASVPQE